ncbi:hypothetical protein [Ruegeria marina]|uniref:Tetratricopeptide repeat-containing protein n=1 Tax=Ruegeria marina TaxID=639004 RepID=A0A1G6SAP0_9RHOB|nr:hypothetical protein [Ruegeria marina]SDD13958.1 hypothetical protein SAMN04488239_105226 [Ruegeria marina]
MPIRSVISRTRNWMAATLVAGLAALPVSAAEPETVQRLTLDQAFEITLRALRDDRPALALQMSEGLLSADQHNPLLHYLQASAYARLQQPDAARRSAARAYRFAEGQPDKFRAAQMAARNALDAGQPTRAQYWLRLTALHSPDDNSDRLIARDYGILRRINPWSFRIRTEVRPSDNVNNGADSARQIIDGEPVIGSLSPSAQALSGTIGIIDLTSAYRFHRSDTAETSVAGRIFVQRVALSSEAKAAAPGLNNSDLANTYGEIGLKHGFKTGAGISVIQAVWGTSWAAGERSYNLARLEASYSRAMGKGRVTLGALLETRFSARFATQEADILGLNALFTHPLDNGDRITLSLAWRNTDAVSPNGTFRAASARVNYDFGKSLGPARISAGLTVGQTDYPTYILFLPSINGFGPVQDGREETSVYGDLNLTFDQYDIAGFAPVLRLRSGRKQSNISRFDIRETSISLGIESKF